MRKAPLWPAMYSSFSARGGALARPPWTINRERRQRAAFYAERSRKCGRVIGPVAPVRPGVARCCHGPSAPIAAAGHLGAADLGPIGCFRALQRPRRQYPG